jgi:hypothetical protein
MLKAWIAGLSIHFAVSVFLALLTLLKTSEQGIAWLPDRNGLILGTLIAFGVGPFLGFFIAFRGPRSSVPYQPGDELRERAGRRIRNIAGLLLVFLMALLLGTLLRNTGAGLPAWTAVVGIGAVALLVLLAPWIALYGRWFSED